MIPLHQLKPGDTFVLQWDQARRTVFELLYSNGSRARVRRIEPERVRLPNGKEFDRLPRPVDISPNSMVEPVGIEEKRPISAAR